MKFEVAEGVIRITVDRKEYENALGLAHKRADSSVTKIQKRLNSINLRRAAIAVTAFAVSVAYSTKKIMRHFAGYETALVDMGKVTSESLASIEKRMKSKKG